MRKHLISGLGSSEQTPSTNSGGTGSNSGGGHYKRNPTNFVPYITGEKTVHTPLLSPLTLLDFALVES